MSVSLASISITMMTGMITVCFLEMFIENKNNTEIFELLINPKVIAAGMITTMSSLMCGIYFDEITKFSNPAIIDDDDDGDSRLAPSEELPEPQNDLDNLRSQIADLERTSNRQNAEIDHCKNMLEVNVNVGETNKTIQCLLERQKKTCSEIKETVASLTCSSVQTNGRLNTTNQNLESLNKKVSRLDDNITDVTGDVMGLRDHVDIDQIILRTIQTIREYFTFFEQHITKIVNGTDTIFVNAVLFKVMSMDITETSQNAPDSKIYKERSVVLFGFSTTIFNKHFEQFRQQFALMDLLKIKFTPIAEIQNTVRQIISKFKPVHNQTIATIIKSIELQHYLPELIQFQVGSCVSSKHGWVPILNVKTPQRQNFNYCKPDDLMFDLNFPHLHESSKQHELRILKTIEERCIYVYNKYKYIRVLFETVDIEPVPTEVKYPEIEQMITRFQGGTLPSKTEATELTPTDNSRLFSPTDNK
jgi:peptidoglycan hydrolase CwlO-like protein